MNMSRCKRCRRKPRLKKGRLCRECLNIYQREWRQNNLYQNRQHQKNYHERHKRKINARKRKWRRANYLKNTNYYRNYYRQHKDAMRETNKRWRSRNRVKVRKAQRRRYWADPVRYCGYAKKYAPRFPEVVRKRGREYAKNNPEKIRVLLHQRRARIEKADGRFTHQEWRELCTSYKWLCGYCETKLTIKTASPDHRIPLARGGTNYIQNIIPSCLPCNLRKHAKTEEEFRALRAA